MFDALTDRLGGIFDGLTGRGALSEKDVNAALRETRIDGPATNRDFLIAVTSDPGFRAGTVWTGFIDAHLDDLLARAAG